MQKVLVTGATGFIGNYVVNELLRRGEQVIASSVSVEKAKEADWYHNVKYIPFNLQQIQDDINYFDFFERPDAVIHLAWEGLPHYKAAFHLQENLPRHQAFLHNLINHGLKNLTVTGTCFEYGMQEGCLSENLPTAPGNAYAEAKDKLRIWLESAVEQTQVSFKWARLFYMYGKGQHPNSLFSQLQASLDRRDELFNMSPGDQLRDFLPVEKMAEYVVGIALQRDYNGAINCCSGKPVSVESLVQKYIKEQAGSIRLNKGVYPYSDLEPKNFWGDTTRLQKIIGTL